VVGWAAMARAGFYAIESHTIRFGRDGEWYSDGQRIENRRIADLFSRSIRARPEGGFMLQVGDERATIEVDDTPFVVRRVDGDPEGGFRVILNDGTVEPLDAVTLRVGDDNVFYCRVRNGAYEARFLRPAYYALARSVEPAPGGGFRLRVRDHTFPIPPRGTS
jgi:uncharacterized protein